MPRILIQAPNEPSVEHTFDIEKNSINIGRAADKNDIIVQHGSVSSRHASIWRLDGKYLIRDLQSTNGIHVGKVYDTEFDLQNGMELFLGDVKMIFELSRTERQILKNEIVVLPKNDSIKAGAEVASGGLGHQQAAFNTNSPVTPVGSMPIRPPVSVTPIVIRKPSDVFGTFMWALVWCVIGYFVGLTLRHFLAEGKFILEDFHYDPKASHAIHKSPTEP